MKTINETGVIKVVVNALALNWCQEIYCTCDNVSFFVISYFVLSSEGV